MRWCASEQGFAFPELLVGAAITVTLAVSLAQVVHQSQGIFLAQPERADMQQRLRVAVDALTGDLQRAGAGLPVGFAAVLPHGDGDAAGGVFFRPDAVTVRYAPWGASEASSCSYYMRRDRSTGTPQLMRLDGEGSDLPLVDHVVALEFEYFPVGEVPIAGAELQDGPWLPNDTDAMRFDADLLRIRRVRVKLRVEASLASMRGPAGDLFTRGGTSTAPERYLPDQELRFDVAVRNLEDEE